MESYLAISGCKNGLPMPKPSTPNIGGFGTKMVLSLQNVLFFA
jgi:hypothetical protein